MIYIFYYKSDSKCEPIGRVMATSLDEAREMISEMKALSEDLIDELFVIKGLENHENDI
jgi:hypothetical protein